MWDDGECSQEDRAGTQAILFSWAIPALILLGGVGVVGHSSALCRLSRRRKSMTTT